jgi:glycosyltransferase involved in cell wall biosynthesis
MSRPIVVVQFQRKPFAGCHSIEGLFRAIRDHWEDDDIRIEMRQLPFFSKGIVSRLRSLLWARRRQADVNHITGDVHFIALGLAKQRTVLTVHDLSILKYYSGWHRFLLKLFWYDLPLRMVGQITTISESTKRELEEQCGVPANRIVVIPNTVDVRFRPCPKPFNAEKPRILQIGAAPHKNLERLVEAISGIRCHLHLVAHPTSSQLELLRCRGIEYTLEQNLSDDDMYRAYCDADIVCLASTMEGFGLPIVEGQHVERVVITSDCSSMPEVAGGGACLVDPGSVQSIREGLLRVISDQAYRETLIQTGRANRMRYAPAVVAKQYAAVYRTCAGH